MKQSLFRPGKPVIGLLLAVSSLGALSLFRVPYSPTTDLFLAAILLLTAFYYLVHWKDPIGKPEFSWGALCLAISFSVSGLFQFLLNMTHTPAMSSRAEKLHLPYVTFSAITACFYILIGFFAFYRLAGWIEKGICSLLSQPRKRTDAFPLFNLLIPLSVIGFFALEPTRTVLSIESAIVSFAAVVTVVLHCPNLLKWSREKHPALQVLSLLSAIGILLFRAGEAAPEALTTAAAVLAFPFVYCGLLALYSWLVSSFRECGTFRDMKKSEWIVYLGIFLAAVIFVTVVFLQTDAFYGSEQEFDVIYTADSSKLVKENAFLALRHQENDLRQPLFAVFAAPFLGLPYLVGRIFSQSAAAIPMLMQLVQLAVLLTANFLLARLMKLDRVKRMIFMGLSTLSYPVLLFMLMMEQYIVAYFWLILCFYLITEKKEQASVALCGAGGTLLTSMILMPGLSRHNPVRSFRLWFTQMMELCLSFLIFMLGIGRLDIILSAPSQLITMMQYSGETISFTDKLYQYSGFFRQAMIAPDAQIDLVTMGHPSWQLTFPTGYSILGLTILCLCIVSFLLNRKDKSSICAGLWIVFSAVILLILGWGIKENGLILYSLYFGWAVWVLLFRLLTRLEEKIPHLTTVVGILGIAALAAVNLPAIWAVVRFACQYYPI